MARPIWTGSISFGLVNIPVKLFSSVSHKEVRYHLLHESDGARVRQKWVCSADGKEVSYDQIVKGYEVSPGQYVTVTQEELERFDPRATRAIEIEAFVRLEEIDPIYYQDSYYLAPDKGAASPYALLLNVMKEAGKVGVARAVIRTRQHLCALRPFNGALALSTMLYHDEIVPLSKIEGLPPAAPKPNPSALTMAKQLVESLTAKFEPSRYKDDYREEILSFIRRKARGEKVVAPPTERRPAKVIDLVEALKASLGQSSKSRRAPARTARSHRPAPKRKGA